MNFRLTALAYLELLIFIVDYIGIDTLLVFVSFYIHFSVWVLISANDLKHVVEIVPVDTIVLLPFHHCPKFLEECIVRLLRPNVLWEEAKSSKN